MLKLKPKNIIFLILYALPNTILSFGIVYIINNVLAGKEDFLHDYMGIVFLSLVIYTYLLNVVYQKWLNKFSFNLLYANEKKVFDHIIKAPLLKLEKFGSKRFFTVVEDLRTFAMLPYTITHTINSLLMLVLCLVYMFTLSIVSALIVIGLIIIVGACYFIVMNSMSKKVAALREYNEHYYQYVDDVMQGFKELKLSFFRRKNLMNRFLIPNRNEARDLDFRINYIFLSINLISQYGLYFVIAAILFVLPEFELLNRDDVISYVVIILFISGPINNLINLQQMYTRFLVANSRIKKFMQDFAVVKDEKNTQITLEHDFKSVKFNNISFSYNDEKNDSTFSLGPINMEIKKGETIFIVGGNGSGKSTFINVLTGLYNSTEGEIYLNDSKELEGKEELQNMIAAVFTDNHIFSHNYEDYEIENNEEYINLLKTMELDKVIEDDKDASARRKFSKGQSKRMSLIFAILEKKPILVLDEWAADQDPHFRKFFYEELIPRLKDSGKTIIAVTHDDAYFHQADRIIKFDYGKIVKDVTVNSEAVLADNLWA
ncbi:putative ATP-binding cassette transporter/putative ATP-binding cassette transporter [Tenacibaculum gallaicum]|uniref:Putative ATP-binding cassette transporter/putative ATP-binding cassette transporter n=1 Tax=Tenacibaculum gallaicum TaxID=561505 RepID=A0A3E0I8C3_9FLAO|nr:cyclic peptide export ABC transporter [Tenacibaculum gallaicum]REH54910.1 putative ATP-binding cassette transporter/putative ATP-binding cassette transporter [Tenacibaculum gallaicum]